MFEDGIAAFWDWWRDGGREALDRAIGGQDDSGNLADTISSLVSDIHPSLEWQLAPGQNARQSLALSAGGQGTLRVIAERWARTAPSTRGWEFHGARIPVDPPELTIEGVPLDPAQARWVGEFDSTYEQLDIGFYMPGFERLDDTARMQAILTYLDAVLGEDASETWIGIIDPLDSEPGGGAPLKALPERVREVANQATGEGWEVIERDDYGAYAVATVNRAVKQLLHMDHVLHVEIIVKMNESNSAGMPSGVEIEDQNEIEDDAVATIGERGVFVGRETSAGLRHLHFFARDDEGLAEEMAEWAEEFDSHDVEAIVTLDPDWSVLNRWL